MIEPSAADMLCDQIDRLIRRITHLEIELGIAIGARDDARRRADALAAELADERQIAGVRLAVETGSASNARRLADFYRVERDRAFDDVERMTAALRKIASATESIGI